MNGAIRLLFAFGSTLVLSAVASAQNHGTSENAHWRS